MPTVPQRKYTIAEFVALEERSQTKHEYYRGEVFAMSGGSRAHARVHGNIYHFLRLRLAGTGCTPFNSDQRIYIPNIDWDTYPDASVICGERERDPNDPEGYTNPRVIFEVLSKTNELYDRTTKFSFYRKLRSLKQYVLVSQSAPVVEVYVRSQNNRWEFTDVTGLDSTLDLSVIQCDLPLKEIYDDVNFDTDAEQQPSEPI